MKTNQLTGHREPSRRSFLRTVGASLAVGASGLAGCMSTLPPLGQRVRFGRVDTPARGDPVYSDWLPQPGALRRESDADEPDPLTSAMYVTPGDLGVEDTGAHVTIGESLIRTQIDYFGMGLGSFDWALAPQPGVVMAGDVDTDAVHDTLTETVYEPFDTHRDFDLYRRTDQPHVVAVSGTHLVFDAGEEAEPNVRTLVDTGRGREERYADVDDEAERLITAVGASPFTWYGIGTLGIESSSDGGQIPDPAGSAHSYMYDGDAVYFVYDLLFPDGTVPTIGEVENALENQPDALRSAGVEVSRNGRLVTVEMRAEVEDLQEGSSEPFIAPQTTWTSSYDAGTERLTLSHHAGDHVDASTLAVDPAGGGRDRVTPDQGDIGPGDTVTVDLSGIADAADSIRIVVEQPDGHSSATIYHFEFPANDTNDAGDAS